MCVRRQDVHPEVNISSITMPYGDTAWGGYTINWAPTSAGRSIPPSPTRGMPLDSVPKEYIHTLTLDPGELITNITVWVDTVARSQGYPAVALSLLTNYGRNFGPPFSPGATMQSFNLGFPAAPDKFPGGWRLAGLQGTGAGLNEIDGIFSLGAIWAYSTTLV